MEAWADALSWLTSSCPCLRRQLSGTAVRASMTVTARALRCEPPRRPRVKSTPCSLQVKQVMLETLASMLHLALLVSGYAREPDFASERGTPF